jgi:hypothetical protein
VAEAREAAVCANCGNPEEAHVTPHRYCHSVQYAAMFGLNANDQYVPQPAPAAPPPAAPPGIADVMEVMELGHRLTGEYIREHFIDEDAPVAAAPSGARAEGLLYHGTNWRTSLDRNVTVALEFAASDLDSDTPNVERALALVNEALRECRRLLCAELADTTEEG